MVTTRPAAPAFRWGNQSRLLNPPYGCRERLRTSLSYLSSRGGLLAARGHSAATATCAGGLLAARGHSCGGSHVASGLFAARGPWPSGTNGSPQSGIFGAAAITLAASGQPMGAQTQHHLRRKGLLAARADFRTETGCWHSRCSIQSNTPLRRSAGATNPPTQPAFGCRERLKDLPVSPCTSATHHACEHVKISPHLPCVCVLGYLRL